MMKLLVLLPIALEKATCCTVKLELAMIEYLNNRVTLIKQKNQRYVFNEGNILYIFSHYVVSKFFLEMKIFYLRCVFFEL